MRKLKRFWGERLGSLDAGDQFLPEKGSDPFVSLTPFLDMLHGLSSFNQWGQTRLILDFSLLLL